ncbi:phage portal protein [Caulobacter sp. FWC2]|uniref:phage portal protein n=1 Tax=Caulobacter sp. FWC2 TaxID=69664 RepID=UPI0013040337|nr:phage portal protein [Caulobacter sp. FWC2]
MRQEPERGTGRTIVTYDPGKLDNKTPPFLRFTMEGDRCKLVERNHGSRQSPKWVSEPGSLFHIMEHNPLASAEGSGAGDAVQPLVEAYIQATRMIRDRMAANGRVEGYFKAPPLETDEQRATYKKSMEDLNSSDAKVLVDTDFITAQLSFTDLDLVATIDSLTRAIASGFGVPAVFLNLAGESSYANQRGADRIYYTGWVKPRALWLMKQLEANLRRDFDPTLELGIDETEVNYLQDDRLEKAAGMTQQGVFTINEIRDVMGYPPIAKGDELAKPMNAPKEAADTETDKPKEVSPNADTSRRNGSKSLAK